MTKQDLMALEEMLDRKFSPLNDMLRQHEHRIRTNEMTLFGPSGDNGIYGDVKEMKQSWGKVKAIVGIAAGAAGLIGTLIGRFLAVEIFK